MTFAAIIRTSPSYATGSVLEFGQGSIAERDAAGSSVKFWVVDSAEPDTSLHDKTYVLKEGGWVEQGSTSSAVNPAGSF